MVVSGIEGTVEEVGFRSTKLRTLTDHLVTIPNSSLINESIENIGRRRTIRRLMNVTITYDTPREKVLAARRSGIRTVILAVANRKNLEEVARSLRKNMRFVFVRDVREVFDAALMEPYANFASRV